MDCNYYLRVSEFPFVVAALAVVHFSSLKLHLQGLHFGFASNPGHVLVPLLHHLGGYELGDLQLLRNVCNIEMGERFMYACYKHAMYHVELLYVTVANDRNSYDNYAANLEKVLMANDEINNKA